ncbi:MAG: D-sedoheptulose 7-phosphate isomerase [Spirochaetia bacterium]|nr:D-sedoheptulose 7-phosphate isomerase [Spirochaetia bacterium]
MNPYIKRELAQSIQVKTEILNDENLLRMVCEVAQKAIETYKNGGKILIAGNGGSAADAQHFAGELISRFNFDRPGLPALALNTDSSTLTAIGNDYGYEFVFSRQIEANGKKGDIFIGISTSGNSLNILRAIEAAKSTGMMTIGLSGISGGKIKALCDYCICVPSDQTPRIQEAHLLLEHIICAVIEEELFGNGFEKNPD